MQRGWRDDEWDQERSRRWQGGDPWSRDPYREREGWQAGPRGGGEGYRGFEGQRGGDWREGDGARGWRGGSQGSTGPRGGYGQQEGAFGRFGGQLGATGYGGGWQDEPQYGPYQHSGGYGRAGGGGGQGYGGASYGGSYGGGYGAQAPYGYGSSMGVEDDYGRYGHEYGGRGRDYERGGQRDEPRGRGTQRGPMPMGLGGGAGWEREGDWGRGMPEWSYAGGGYGQSSGRGGAGTLGRRGNRRGPKNYQRSDERIREDVCDRLMSTDLDCGDIEIQVEKGEVKLTGSADSGEARREIERVAEGVAGVKDVVNQIRTKRDQEEEDSQRRSRAQQTGSQGSSQGQTSGGSGSTGQQGRQTSSSPRT